MCIDAWEHEHVMVDEERTQAEIANVSEEVPQAFVVVLISYIAAPLPCPV